MKKSTLFFAGLIALLVGLIRVFSAEQKIAPAQVTGGVIAGALGSTDNVLLRSDGTGGGTAQGSNATLDDTGNMVVLTATATNVTANGILTGQTVYNRKTSEATFAPSVASGTSPSVTVLGGSNAGKITLTTTDSSGFGITVFTNNPTASTAYVIYYMAMPSSF